jgi:hypothetical protein
MEARSVEVRAAGGTNERCELEIATRPPWTLVFSGAGLVGVSFAANDLFEALILLRRELAKGGIQLMCAGARRDVFPSGMSRSMSGGRKAYVTRAATHPTLEDLVDIFDDADVSLVGSVSEQKEHHERWLQSIRPIGR